MIHFHFAMECWRGQVQNQGVLQQSRQGMKVVMNQGLRAGLMRSV